MPKFTIAVFGKIVVVPGHSFPVLCLFLGFVFLYVPSAKEDLICKLRDRLHVHVHVALFVFLWSLNYVPFTSRFVFKLLGESSSHAWNWSCICLYLEDCSFQRGCNVYEILFWFPIMQLIMSTIIWLALNCPHVFLLEYFVFSLLNCVIFSRCLSYSGRLSIFLHYLA